MQRRVQAIHPLAKLIESVADRQFLPVDGGWHRVVPWRVNLDAIVSFTGHAVFAVSPDILDEQLRLLGPTVSAALMILV